MQIWHYHPATGLLLGTSEADPSPLEPGVWLIPAHATAELPPTAAAGEEAHWQDGAWHLRPVPAPEPVPEPDPATPPAPRHLAKTAIIRRATDAELELLTATLASLPLRERLLWQDAEGGVVIVDEVRPLFVDAVGAARADELLAP